jgi:hypothetical protein
MLASRRWRDWKPSEVIDAGSDKEPTKPTKTDSVSFVSTSLGPSQKSTPPSVIRMPETFPDPQQWHDAFLMWIASDCIADRLLHGSIGGLLIAFSEWEVEQGEVPCSRTVFEHLLLEQGWEIDPTLALVPGLSLRRYVDGTGYFSESQSGQSPRTTQFRRNR